ncbi:hypothetical protein K1T71_004585 [Dendrolimus kikuchii]|uniref:Uncharacterized protein n=1 Tax=Dendrolimus kikuchii TaxID=765133 RepID=A0ACC1D8D2_9NEOP|nr:hypothetical protein K1T71_004585 [Dendrolimus kikuchii]
MKGIIHYMENSSTFIMKSKVTDYIEEEKEQICEEAYRYNMSIPFVSFYMEMCYMVFPVTGFGGSSRVAEARVASAGDVREQAGEQMRLEAHLARSDTWLEHLGRWRATDNSAEILVLVGFPGSGKSFLAKQIEKKSDFKYATVCRDVLGSWQKCATEAVKLVQMDVTLPLPRDE